MNRLSKILHFISPSNELEPTQHLTTDKRKDDNTSNSLPSSYSSPLPQIKLVMKKANKNHRDQSYDDDVNSVYYDNTVLIDFTEIVTDQYDDGEEKIENVEISYYHGVLVSLEYESRCADSNSERDCWVNIYNTTSYNLRNIPSHSLILNDFDILNGEKGDDHSQIELQLEGCVSKRLCFKPLQVFALPKTHFFLEDAIDPSYNKKLEIFWVNSGTHTVWYNDANFENIELYLKCDNQVSNSIERQLKIGDKKKYEIQSNNVEIISVDIEQDCLNIEEEEEEEEKEEDDEEEEEEEEEEEKQAQRKKCLTLEMDSVNVTINLISEEKRDRPRSHHEDFGYYVYDKRGNKTATYISRGKNSYSEAHCINMYGY